ncbi:hypothetical protein LTR16_001675 [Cryomyces antarcticus]|uniref:Uncharacterized protein n=1 Tax=Cryomyces antarcticus TaxID=329879 RepID=A0ABR0M0S3_9PEZI|nr:hypothetical protein LTR16_001675 [Cryomyces antarcticus]
MSASSMSEGSEDGFDEQSASSMGEGSGEGSEKDSENSSDGQSTPKSESLGPYKDADDIIKLSMTSGVEPNPVQPGLYIEGIGIVGLPLGERDAKAIIQASHQAPFGKGNETLVDVTVRKTWELNADQFQLRNPAWSKFLQKILDNTAEALGVHVSGLRAELYKLLLYEEGAMFKLHQEQVP